MMKFKLPKTNPKVINQFDDFFAVREHARKKHAVLMDFYMQDNKIYTLRREWTELPADWIYQQGYYLGDKFQTEIKYYGVKTYVRFHNWKQCNAADYGNFMSSATLYDYLKSDTSTRFISGMTKLTFAPIDLKMIIVALPIIAGIIIGMLYFMGGR